MVAVSSQRIGSVGTRPDAVTRSSLDPDQLDNNILPTNRLRKTTGEENTKVATVKQELIKLGLTSCRGERAKPADVSELRRLVRQLVDSTNIDEMKRHSLEGAWDLVISDTQLFRSSPFFMAARAVVPDGQQADQFNWFCDQHRAALDFSQIGRVRQVVSSTQVRSEFEVKVGLATLALGLPLTVSGAIVTTAEIVGRVGSSEAVESWELAIKSVQVEDSNVPGLRDALATWLQLPIGPITSALESTPINVETWRPVPLFRTIYLDEDMRVSKDQDDNLFVYIRS